MRHRLALAFWAPVFLVTLYVSSRGIGPVPPLGPFLDPIHGIWSVAATATLPDSARAEITGLDGPVDVVYDDRGVPHIFASSTRDAVRALGYVVARDRLFQMEMQTRATAGTLTELLGDVALPVDQQSRRLGLAWSAERNYANLDPAAAGLLDAYSKGVNSWIDQLDASRLPLEYRLLSAEPSAWLPQHTLYLLKRMGNTLAWGDVERTKERVAAMVGRDAADDLFPVNSPIQEPVQSNGANEARFDSVEIAPPGSPDPMATDRFRLRQLAFGATTDSADCATALFDCPGEDVVGSNNWAIGPLKSVSGHAVLAGDPHLNLTLPSIWYEVHMNVPDELDVYGVTIPGTPSVTIGFNRDVAWSLTNTGADVLDFYDEMFDNPDAPTRYMLDGTWRDLTARVEEYRDTKGRVLAVDTIYHTHRGPVLRDGNRNLSVRWTVLDDQGALSPFADIAVATSVDDWLSAMEAFHAPAQNGLVADRYGSIALRSHGGYPIRPSGREGDAILDGTTSTTDWIGFWPVSAYPFSIDPARGFLSSANQQPIDPRANGSYLGSDWPSPWRAMRINSMLRGAGRLTPEDMRSMQTDPGSARADFFTPFFLAAGEAALTIEPTDTTLGQALRLLGDWNLQYTPENDRAVLFELAMEQLADLTWDELVRGETRVATPGSAVLAALLMHHDNAWWDIRSTTQVETRDSILTRSLREAFREARRTLGPEDEDGWLWQNVRSANIYHLLRIPGLSSLRIPIQGGPSTINPLSGSGTHGASWRMVVELGDTVGAWVTYPGGQSGNPASRFYADRVAEWAQGDLSIPLFPNVAAEVPDERIVSRLILRGTG